MLARDNPFAVERVHQLAYVHRESSWPALWQRLEQVGYRAVIWGAEGSGKTTLLTELSTRLQQQGWQVVECCLNEAQPRLPATFKLHRWTRRHLVMLDGADRLSSIAWQLFRWRLRRAGGLILTTHRPGRLPTLIHCRTDVRLLQALVRQLLSGDPKGLPSDLPPEHGWVDNVCQQLWERHRGNVRDALRELYDLAAEDRLPSLNKPFD